MSQFLEDDNQEEELFEHHSFTVDPGQETTRIDKWLCDRIANASRTKVQAAIEADCVLVNDRSIKNNYKIKPGDKIRVLLPEPPRDTEVYGEDLPLDILYEDSHLLVLNKAAGMVVHPGFNNYSGTLVNALVYHFGQLPQKDAYHRPGLVHRIDKDTSGLLVIGKTEFTLSHLGKQFYEHSIHRRYWALVWGDVKEDEGTIRGQLARDLKDRRKSKHYDDPEIGKLAITHYKVLERYHFCTLVECRLETGRTHQIRAHMTHLGHPLFSDEMYGGRDIRKESALPRYKQFIANGFEIMPRQALHAKELGFVHPQSQEWMQFDCPLPDDFQQLLEKIRTYTGALYS